MNDIQKERYQRHVIIPEVGIDGQKKIFNAKVLVVGAGGLGSPILQYLVAAGVGTIGIVDDDTISLSNLQRQILYNETQLGKSKVTMAKKALSKLNTNTNIISYPFALNKHNAKDIIKDFEIVIGATDNFESRIHIDHITKEMQIPFINGSINEFEGQVAVFNYNGSMSYTDLFPETPNQSSQPIGVISPLPGIIGSIQACEALKIILNAGNLLTNKLLIYDALNLNINVIEFEASHLYKHA